MKKYISLIKANLSEGMNIFNLSTKKKNTFTKWTLPIILTVLVMVSIYSYADAMLEKLHSINMDFVVLTLFIIATSVFTIVEGTYKSGSLLFNCKDDNLLFSLPIKKKVVLSIRILKFYLFELVFNSIFIIPAMIAYVKYVHPGFSYYVVSVIGILMFPIIPILLSCIIGTVITFLASYFSGKNFVQTFLTTIFLIGILYVSFNFEKLIINLTINASSLNDIITKIYYPAGAYIQLITNFNNLKLMEFIGINILSFIFTIMLIGKIYFNINSKVKAIKIRKLSKKYKIKTTSQIRALIKKEFSRFINSTVFVTNAGFGLVLFVIACILLIIKFDTFANAIIQIKPDITMDYIKSNISLILFAIICFSSFMTSITSSMISLEGKTFNILKSLPVKPYTIVKAKVLTAVFIMIPFFLIGDILIFLNFNLDLLGMLLITISSVLLPILTQTIGIIVNLKYPKLDAKNDTEVVKQSMSSAISVFIGMALLVTTAFLLFKAIEANIYSNIIMIMFICVYLVICAGLILLLNKTCEKSFKNL